MLTHTLRAASLAFLTLTLSMPAAQAADDKVEALARELMELTGAANLGEQTMQAMMAEFAKLGVPPEFSERFMAKANADQLVELVVPIYVETYDEKTLKAALKFYRSKEGALLVSKMPEINERAMAAGQAWGAALAQEVIEEMQAEAESGGE